MAILGLVFTILFYNSLFVTLFLYIYFFFKRRYKYSEALLQTIFLQSLVVTMALSWCLILMNSGFDVNFYLNIDYTLVLIFMLPGLIFLVVVDLLLQRWSAKELVGLKRAFRYILPVLTILLLAASTMIFYFNINYFIYLNL